LKSAAGCRGPKHWPPTRARAESEVGLISGDKTADLEKLMSGVVGARAAWRSGGPALGRRQHDARYRDCRVDEWSWCSANGVRLGPHQGRRDHQRIARPFPHSAHRHGSGLEEKMTTT
jgi:hypothetical protein